MTYGIQYLTHDGWQPDQTGSYKTLAEAEQMARLADVIFHRVSHRVVQHPAPAEPSGRRAAIGRANRGDYRA